jgi:hypothetical protein
MAAIGREGRQIGEVGKDIHTVNISTRIIGVVLVGAAFAGWGIGNAVDVARPTATA